MRSAIEADGRMRMENLEAKNVLVGVCGGIAAYKIVEVCRQLIKGGSNVKVIMTDSAQKFVTPLTFRTVTGQTVATSLFDDPGHPVPHVSLCEEADIILVAPATANIIAKYAGGIADDLLTTTLQAARGKVVLAPSMNARMYMNPATQENISRLRERGAEIIEPGEGYLACGYEGIGRLAEPAEMVERVDVLLGRCRDLEGYSILVTGGSTRERLDPVRFISNPSSGRMGICIANSAADRGADVTLILGPTGLMTGPGIKRIDVNTAAEMKEAVLSHVTEADALIMAAAVADYRPRQALDSKRKKDNEVWRIELEPTEDILGSIKGRDEGTVLVGFAAETEEVIDNARKKLERKGLDLIVANRVGGRHTGFAAENTEATVVKKDGEIEELGMVSKPSLSETLMDRVSEILKG